MPQNQAYQWAGLGWGLSCPTPALNSYYIQARPFAGLSQDTLCPVPKGNLFQTSIVGKYGVHFIKMGIFVNQVGHTPYGWIIVKRNHAQKFLHDCYHLLRLFCQNCSFKHSHKTTIKLRKNIPSQQRKIQVNFFFPVHQVQQKLPSQCHEISQSFHHFIHPCSDHPFYPQSPGGLNCPSPAH